MQIQWDEPAYLYLIVLFTNNGPQVACGGPVACEVDTRSVHVEPGSPVGMIPAHTLGTCMYVASLLYHNLLQPTRKLVSSLHTALLFLPHFPTLCFYTLP